MPRSVGGLLFGHGFSPPLLNTKEVMSDSPLPDGAIREHTLRNNKFIISTQLIEGKDGGWTNDHQICNLCPFLWIDILSLACKFSMESLFSSMMEEIEITPNSPACRAALDGMLTGDTGHHGVCYRWWVTRSRQDAQVRLLGARKPTQHAHHVPRRARVGNADCVLGPWFVLCPFLNKYLSEVFKSI